MAMNRVINVHGVPAGSEQAIGTAVQKAIQDPNRRRWNKSKRRGTTRPGSGMFERAPQSPQEAF